MQHVCISFDKHRPAVSQRYHRSARYSELPCDPGWMTHPCLSLPLSRHLQPGCVQALRLQRPGGQPDRYGCCAGLLPLQWFSAVSVRFRQMWGQVRVLWPVVATNSTLLLLTILLFSSAPIPGVNMPEHDSESGHCVAGEQAATARVCPSPCDVARRLDHGLFTAAC